MYSWILAHRDDIFIFVGISMVILPLLMGVFVGNVPKEFLIRVGLPFILLTFSMALGIFFLKRVLSPLPMLAVSIVFGLTWAGMGAQGLLRRNENWLNSGGPMPQAIKGLSWVFCLFGILWIGIAVGNYLGWVLPKGS